MALFLVEFDGSGRSRDDVRPLFDRVADVVRRSGGEFIEAQVASSLRHVFVVVEHGDEAALGRALHEGGLSARGIAQVRLVGASLDEVKAARRPADYLVEWDFPAGLTMDAYLARKQANAPRYAEVPQVRFLRTYVCEDMSRCLCVYRAPDEAAVRRAREVVGAPVSRLTALVAPGTTSTGHTAEPAAGAQAGGVRGGRA